MWQGLKRPQFYAVTEPIGRPHRHRQPVFLSVAWGSPPQIAFIGFCSQAAVQGMGPIESLKFHLADPAHNNSESACSLCIGSPSFQGKPPDPAKAQPARPLHMSHSSARCDQHLPVPYLHAGVPDLDGCFCSLHLECGC